MDFTKRIAAFVRLGEKLREDPPGADLADWEEASRQQSLENSWFIPDFIWNARLALAEMLRPEALYALEDSYRARKNLDFEQKGRIAVISAGNIPMAGFHDFFAVLASGHHYVGKLSSRDRLLLPAVARLLVRLEPAFGERISFVEKLSGFDRIIATGSNNSSRYFEYYFGKYPHILRKNRSSLAVLTGEESPEELRLLFDDLFLYFGLGCRSVSLLFLPEGYAMEPLLSVFAEKGGLLARHHHYLNNIAYQKTIRWMNQSPFIDGGIALLAEEESLHSPIGVIHYQYYRDGEEAERFIAGHAGEIQCVACNRIPLATAIPLGKTQFPKIHDFADGVDTLSWAAQPPIL